MRAPLLTPIFAFLSPMLFSGAIYSGLFLSSLFLSVAQAQDRPIAKVCDSVQRAMRAEAIRCPNCVVYSNSFASVEKLLGPIGQDAYETGYGRLRTLESLIRQKKQPLDTPIAHAIADIYRQYPTPKLRRENAAMYMHDVTEILRKTESGRRSLGCYLGFKHPALEDSEVYFSHNIPEKFRKQVGELGPDIAMQIHELAGSRPGKLIRAISFNVALDPMDAIPVYAHELMHGCDADNFDLYSQRDVIIARHGALDAQIEPEGLVPANWWASVKRYWLSNEAVRLTRALQRSKLIGEVKAYERASEVFAELAKAMPEFVCRSGVTGSYLETELQLSRGTFPYYLVQQYTQLGQFGKDRFYEQPPRYLFESAGIAPEISLSTRLFLREAGIKVFEPTEDSRQEGMEKWKSANRTSDPPRTPR